MGYVRIAIKVENYDDLKRARGRGRGARARRVRTVFIPDALVDTGATYLCLPRRCIRALGLEPYPGKIYSETANGIIERTLYRNAFLTLEGRSAECKAVEVPDEVPALIGVIPLEEMDFLVDPTTQKLIGKHGKKRVTLMY